MAAWHPQQAVPLWEISATRRLFRIRPITTSTRAPGAGTRTTHQNLRKMNMEARTVMTVRASLTLFMAGHKNITVSYRSTSLLRGIPTRVVGCNPVVERVNQIGRASCRERVEISVDAGL